jgi:hypothetical protein
MKNEMPSLLLDEKICFIRLPLDTLQNSSRSLHPPPGLRILAFFGNLVIQPYHLWCVLVLMCTIKP